MLLAEVVEASSRITATSKRLAKIALLASLLKRLSPEEIETAVAFLSGTTRQGRIGIGSSVWTRNICSTESIHGFAVGKVFHQRPGRFRFVLRRLRDLLWP